MNAYTELSDALACLLRERKSMEFCKELSYVPDGSAVPGFLTKENYDFVNEKAQVDHEQAAKRFAQSLYKVWQTEDYNNSMR